MVEQVGQILFIVAVLGMGILVASGTLFGAFTLLLAALIGPENAKTPDHPDRLFHHPDYVATSAYETLFMVFATALVALGLPTAIAAIFYYVVPMVGDSWVR